MARAADPPDVRLLCGMLSAQPALLDRAAVALAESFGPVDLRSETLAFDFTDYYTLQMGAPLWRQFVAFERPIRPDALAAVKRTTNELEARLAADAGAAPPRPVNLDPGYVAPAKLVLASMKDFAHRVYLGGGVYAEVTLQYRGGRWQPLPWTFPDYASGEYDAFLSAVRQRLGDRDGKGVVR